MKLQICLCLRDCLWAAASVFLDIIYYLVLYYFSQALLYQLTSGPQNHSCPDLFLHVTPLDFTLPAHPNSSFIKFLSQSERLVPYITQCTLQMYC